MKVALINMGIGNVTSVFYALKEVGFEVDVLSVPPVSFDYDGMVLPGVGSFAYASKWLDFSGWKNTLLEQTSIQKKYFLGICLGMQLLGEVGFEGGKSEGLGIIPGNVVKLENVRLPHIGWDDIEIAKDTRLFKDIKNNSSFYFVHSYYLDTEPTYVTSYCQYCNIRFPASVELDNIFGVQFHPEKSQKKGLNLIKNFYDIMRC